MLFHPSKITPLKHFILSLCVLLAGMQVFAQQQTISSPDKKIKVSVSLKGGQISYSVTHNNQTILEPSTLGLELEGGNFTDNLKWISVSKPSVVNDAYKTVNAKKSSIKYTANKQEIHLQNNKQQKLDIIFQLSNDGVAFRYYLPGKTGDVKTIIAEKTTYIFHPQTKAWLQPMSVAKTGWEKTNPSYEEHYEQDIAVGKPSKVGWIYPALFKKDNTWMLISEAGMDGSWCGTRLVNDSASPVYKVAFPDAREVIFDKGLLPKSATPWYSPWRFITIGSLATIAESTLGTDLAAPAVTMDNAFIKPGKASWSWIMSKDDFIVYDEQIKYINFAADMGWKYCLIDADWDRKIGYEKIKELSDYAATKKVSLILWYNSAGDWNTVKYTPKNLLLTHELREKEFARLEAMGIKGVKIDFFGGDGQSVFQYYVDILKDAATHHLLVNFHGATLPRGWSRTYPNLMTTEAIAGFEMVTFEQTAADVEANHATMFPFTRNAFDPMDFTPMNLYKVQSKVERKTTSAFELATSVLFLSGIQHYAESPEGMAHVPAFVKDFVKVVPNYWDDVKFVTGYPGKDVVIARRAGNKWYVAGINGENTEKKMALDLSFLKNAGFQLITDGAAPLSFEQQNVQLSKGKKLEITLKPNGGFVIVQ